MVGTRTQYPIVLFYASTCHKVQGLTLPGAVIHCTKEFVPGLVYVAASRVKHEDNIQRFNFSGKQLLRPTEEAKSVYSLGLGPTDGSCTCCNQQEVNPTLLAVYDKGEAFVEDRDAPESIPTVAFPVVLVSSFFEADDDSIVVDLAHVHRTLHQNEGELTAPPEQFKEEEIIEEQRIPQPMTDFASTKNALLTYVNTGRTVTTQRV